METRARDHARRALGPHPAVGPHAGRVAVRWSAADRRDRPRRPVELQGRHPRRADRGAGRRPDRAGPRAGPPAGRPRPRRRPDQPQPQRRLPGRRRHRRALPRPAGRDQVAAKDVTHEPGGRADHHRPGQRARAAPRRRTERTHEHHHEEPGTDPEPSAPTSSAGSRGSFDDYVTKVKGGDVGALPAIAGLIVLVIVFTILTGSKFTNAFNFSNLILQGSAVAIVRDGPGLRAADRRDRPVGRLHRWRHRRRPRAS